MKESDLGALTEKLHTLGWFLARPSFWPHMVALARRKIDGSAAHEDQAAAAEAWAAEHAVSVQQALRATGCLAEGEAIPAPLADSLLAEGSARAARSGVDMGGPGDLELIHAAVLASDARTVIETGVAYGWSSLAALAALQRTGGRLISVDMPYPKMGNEAFVGIVVPEDWRTRWTLIRMPDRNGVRRAIAAAGGQVDLVHYDSDKTYAGRRFAYPLLWDALAPGGLFISDDIQDNFGFRDFCMEQGVPFAVTASQGKYVGLMRKPATTR